MATATRLRAEAIKNSNGKFSITDCVRALDELQGVDDQVYHAALDLFNNRNARETFLTLRVEKRLIWLQRKFSTVPFHSLSSLSLSSLGRCYFISLSSSKYHTSNNILRDMVFAFQSHLEQLDIRVDLDLLRYILLVTLRSSEALNEKCLSSKLEQSYVYSYTGDDRVYVAACSHSLCFLPSGTVYSFHIMYSYS
ncbi:hypothetical protein Sango_1858400 [Sesamum angolense]|uniref:Uncharacterized protein n=1 Tax=Sesamum angolense TaxID=2727404 RepID=A0AAE2BQB2_9LAMI|nr:hypothetical protein Sango_1858400 [Sesamum angolense]